MNTTTLRRLVWGPLGLVCVGFWALALVGAAALADRPDCPSVWEAAKSTRAGAR